MESGERRSRDLLDEVREELPRRYIRVHSIDISVDGIKVGKLQWERRLVETTAFEIRIDPEIPWEVDENLPLEQGASSSADDGSAVPANKTQTMRFVVGFDPSNAHDECRPLVHSRESGRLVRKRDDARGEPRPNAASTDFARGLAVPLNGVRGRAVEGSQGQHPRLKEGEEGREGGRREGFDRPTDEAPSQARTAQDGRVGLRLTQGEQDRHEAQKEL